MTIFFEKHVFWICIAVAAGAFGALLFLHGFLYLPAEGAGREAPVATTSLSYAFDAGGMIQETEQQDARNPDWWLNSGGSFVITEGTGKTIQGELLPLHRWRLAYLFTNPVDTDNGYHPQNVFRLVSRNVWMNPQMSVSFRIVRDNLTDSPNRNESNGVFLMNRYIDGDNLYYAGIRVDGTAVIKKKYHGVYRTLAQAPLFAGSYGRDAMPNLLPHSEWIELTSRTMDDPDGSVVIDLFMRRAGETEPSLILKAADTDPILGKAAVGIRTDFMDVEIKDIRISETAVH